MTDTDDVKAATARKLRRHIGARVLARAVSGPRDAPLLSLLVSTDDTRALMQCALECITDAFDVDPSAAQTLVVLGIRLAHEGATRTDVPFTQRVVIGMDDAVIDALHDMLCDDTPAADDIGEPEARA